MINSDKIGKFIAELREKKNLSQGNLGKLIGIGRESISKWERGVNIPSYEMLLKLSDVFGVSVNEILYGESLNNQNKDKIKGITALLYADFEKSKKLIKKLLIMILCIIAIFGIYYFSNSYKSIKVYTISGAGDNVIIDNGVFINTKGKIYFSINELNVKNGLNIEKITLYYKDIKNLIYSGDATNILISQRYGENEYFETKYLKDVVYNLYLLVEYDNGKREEIKLFFTQDYINDILFFKKAKQTGTNKESDKLVLAPADLSYLLSIIEKKFKKEGDVYTYNKAKDSLEYSAFYIPKTGSISLSINKNQLVLEEWNFDTYSKSLIYYLYDGHNVSYNFSYENDKVQCLVGNCENAEEKIKYFWTYLHEL